MIRDAREIGEGQFVETDLCIVGAGAAGITIAREFAHRGHAVVVLESGGLEADDETQELYAGEVEDPWYDPLTVARLRYFGGSTNHWAGFCRMLDEADFIPRPGDPLSGWPFRRETLLPYYARAAEVAQTGRLTRVQDWTDGEWRRTLPFDPERIVSDLHYRSPPLRFGPAYRDELAAAPNIDIQLHANLVDIETDEDARHVTSLRVQTLSGRSYEVRSRATVLATGGIENARLLLNTEANRRMGLGNANDLVGRHFMDHPLLFATGELVPSDPEMPAEFYGEMNKGNVQVRGLTTMPDALVVAEDIANVVVTWTVERDYSEGDHSASRLLNAVREGEWPDDLSRDLGNVISDIDEVAETAYRRLTGTPTPISVMKIHCRVGTTPDPASRVRLTADRDALGLRRAALDWRPGDKGVAGLRRIHELIALEAGRLGLGRLQVKFDAESDAWPLSMIPSYHHIGTTRMADDPRRGVVDANCRVHGMDNLYVAGSSVFPTAGANNPTFTIVALALRLADHLAETLEG